MSQIKDIAARLKSGQLSGLDGKLFLAKTIVTDLHGPADAAAALEAYQSLTSKGKDFAGESFIEASVKPGQSIIDVLVESGLASSRSEARRLVTGNGVRIDDQTVDDAWAVSADSQGAVLQVGKKKHQNHRLLVVAR